MVEHERGEHADGDDDPQKGRRADGGGGVELGQDQQNAQKTAEPGPPGHLPELLSRGDFELSQREPAREQGGGADEQRQQRRRDGQAERLRQGRVLSRLDRVGETGEDRQGVEGPHSRDSPPARRQVSRLRQSRRPNPGSGRSRSDGANAARAQAPRSGARPLRSGRSPGGLRRAGTGDGLRRLPSHAPVGGAGGLDKASPSAEGFWGIF